VFLVQLGFHQTPILKCTIMAQYKYYKAKILFKEDARCLPLSTEREKLASAKLGVQSNGGQNLCGMMYEVNARHNDKEGKSDTTHKL
jgi:hypothetical protein